MIPTSLIQPYSHNCLSCMDHSTIGNPDNPTGHILLESCQIIKVLLYVHAHNTNCTIIIIKS